MGGNFDSWYMDCDLTMAAMIRGEWGHVIGQSQGQNLNSANSDVAVDIPIGKYTVRRVVITNPSTSLAASLATLGVFTGAGATGITVVSLATMTALTSATKFIDAVIAATPLTDVLTAAQLFIRTGIAHGSAATVDVYVIGEMLQ